MRNFLRQLLNRFNLHPVLFDVGASGGPPRIWDAIAERSIYVGFDPDERGSREPPQRKYHKATIIDAAVISDADRDKVSLYLTRGLECSSTLKPASMSLSRYLFSGLFDIVEEKVVPATTLNVVLEKLGLSRIDWLKIDTQGTDLRIFNSLREDARSHLLALDIEPGLIAAYEEEDLFVEAHRFLTGNGFWLSNLKVGGSVRMSRSVLEAAGHHHKGLTPSAVESVVRPSPGWCEARYLRTPEWLQERRFDRNEYRLLWVFAMLDAQPAFAIEVAACYESVFGADGASALMLRESLARLNRLQRQRQLASALSSPSRLLGHLWRTLPGNRRL